MKKKKKEIELYLPKWFNVWHEVYPIINDKGHDIVWPRRRDKKDDGLMRLA